MSTVADSPNRIKSNLEYALWMYCVLTVEADKWAYLIKENTAFQFKHRVNTVLAANKSLINYIKDNNLIDLLEDQGEWFSKALDVILKTDDVRKKEELALLLQAYTEGKTEECVDYLPKEKVIEFVSTFTTATPEIIENAYNRFKEEK